MTTLAWIGVAAAIVVACMGVAAAVLNALGLLVAKDPFDEQQESDV